MALPLFIRKLMAPVEVKLVLSAFSEEARQLKDDPKRALAGGIATDIITPKVVDNILGFAKQISRDIHNGGGPPKAQPRWLSAAYGSFVNKKGSNYQMQMGVIFRYDRCPELRQTDAIDLVAAAWLIVASFLVLSNFYALNAEPLTGGHEFIRVDGLGDTRFR